MADLIAFFSRADQNYVNGEIRDLSVGNTEVAAGMIQKLTGGDTFKIEPRHAYSKNYNECIAQAQDDQRRDARPELAGYPASIDSYEIIYLGFPNYWGTMPMAVYTFLEYFDFTGKTIKPFCTHEGSGLGSSVRDIQKLCSGANVESGLALRGGSVKNAGKNIEEWVSAR
ncbi:flavodoxin [Clostridium sp. chh4-2]|uniref:flavodoxin n=1 Tax=Clostridium sp. chh4-2 TaxID=2067550 RepID=UPI000CCECAA8|nr:flavodoxin [Clostridium sp. chh4-2]PNV62769.1 flavodoxin [Clostridium sp. chh4-2]